VPDIDGGAREAHLRFAAEAEDGGDRWLLLAVDLYDALLLEQVVHRVGGAIVTSALNSALDVRCNLIYIK
jgi:hypothetical protein